MIVFISFFLFPWSIFIILVKKSKFRTLFLTGIFASMLALLVNVLRHNFNWWSFNDVLISTIDVQIFADLGLYPVEAMLLINFLPKKLYKWPIFIILFSIFNTFSEAILINKNYLYYHNGWNIYYTFISYVIPFTLVIIHFFMYNYKKPCKN